MEKFPNNLSKKIEKRILENEFRNLFSSKGMIDFSSNDYLGFANSKIIFEEALKATPTLSGAINGATGSRLISGNYTLYNEVEPLLCKIFNADAALIFNSGYDANIGFWQCVPQRDDIILFDEWVHASIREGIRLSLAKSYKFKHNNLEHLKSLLKKFNNKDVSNIYVVTESIFSMDGDTPDLLPMANLVQSQGGYLVIDEAHATGVAGKRGLGFIQDLQIEALVFARLITFGKALGAHGAAVLGSQKLIDYLTNFAKSFIYTTALPPHTLATIKVVLQCLDNNFYKEEIKKLKQNINYFKTKVVLLKEPIQFLNNDYAIQVLILGEVNATLKIASMLNKNGISVIPIRYPTVPKGQERLRICLHSYNTKEEIDLFFEILFQLTN